MIRPAGMFAGREILARWTVGFVAGLLRRAIDRPASGLHHPDLARLVASEERLDPEGSE